jgi:hypothetical protein
MIELSFENHNLKKTFHIYFGSSTYVMYEIMSSLVFVTSMDIVLSWQCLKLSDDLFITQTPSTPCPLIV